MEFSIHVWVREGGDVGVVGVGLLGGVLLEDLGSIPLRLEKNSNMHKNMKIKITWY